MKIKAKFCDFGESITGENKLTLIIEKTWELSDWLKKNLDNDKNVFSLDLDIWREHRSKQANSYLWVLCSALAEKMNNSKQKIYEIELEKYGNSVVVSIITEAVETFLREIKYYKILGTGVLKSAEYTHIKVIIGSHEYNTSEMSHLINGVVSDCKEEGIPTLDDIEIERMVNAWKP